MCVYSYENIYVALPYVRLSLLSPVKVKEATHISMFNPQCEF